MGGSCCVMTMSFDHLVIALWGRVLPFCVLKHNLANITYIKLCVIFLENYLRESYKMEVSPIEWWRTRTCTHGSVFESPELLRGSEERLPA